MSSQTGRKRKYLVRKYDEQRGLCCYCDGPTWLSARESRAQAAVRLGIPIGANGANQMLVSTRATFEHLKRKADGGALRNNDAMACQACNNSRGDSEVEAHRIDMQVLVAAGLHPTNRPRFPDNPEAHRKAGLKALKKLRAGKPLATVPTQGGSR